MGTKLIITVEPPITDSPRCGLHASIQQTNNMPMIDFAIEIIHFQCPRDGQPPISGQQTETCPQRISLVAVQKSLSERTEIETLGGKFEISIKISIDS